VRVDGDMLGLCTSDFPDEAPQDPSRAWLTGTDQNGLTDLNAASTWQQVQADLSAFAGQTVQLRLAATTDGSLVTDFFVDDLSVTACAATTATQKIFLPLTSRNQ